jgi:hypothetical protein
MALTILAVTFFGLLIIGVPVLPRRGEVRPAMIHPDGPGNSDRTAGPHSARMAISPSAV